MNTAVPVPLDNENLYFYADVTPLEGGHVNIEITSEDCSLQLVEVLPNMCPSDDLVFARIDSPTELTTSPSICKYTISLSGTQEGMLYIRMQPIKLDGSLVWLSVTPASCSFNCGYGYCVGEEICSCFTTDWQGELCDIPLEPAAPPATDPTDIPLREMIFIFAIMVVAGFIVIGAAILIAKIIFRKKRPAPDDTLFNMLAQEQDLDLM